MRPLASLLLLLTGCLDAPDDGAAGDELTSAEGVEFTIEWDGFVYVPRGADDGTVKWHIQRQIKNSLGALREVSA
jgi:hypothetical protein